MTLGTRVAVMNNGALEQVAPPLDVYSRPANAFVAGFVGSPAMNLWPSRAGVVDSARLGVAAAHGRDVLVGARPHDIDLVGRDDADGVGSIELVEPLGPVTLVHIRVDGLRNAFFRVVVPSNDARGITGQVGFRLRRDRLHVFDAETGLRLN